jgi:hypothetical protein
MLAADLNAALPERYYAETNVHFGIEFAMAPTNRSNVAPAGAIIGSDWPAISWTPPEPTLTIPFSHTTDIAEVTVFDTLEGPELVGVLELVGPRNKDSSEHRQTFTAKCEHLLQEGLGLVIVDIVTSGHANLHAILLKRLGNAIASPKPQPLFASAYRPIDHDGDSRLEVWHEELPVGETLPVMPLWLRSGPCMPINLESTYRRMCRGLKIGGESLRSVPAGTD